MSGSMNDPNDPDLIPPIGDPPEADDMADPDMDEDVDGEDDPDEV
jgi:hypothetical protein